MPNPRQFWHDSKQRTKILAAYKRFLDRTRASIFPNITADEASRLIDCPQPDHHPLNLYHVREYKGPVLIDPKTAILFKGTKQIIGSTDRLARENKPGYRALFFSKPQKVNAVISLLNKWDNNYYHLFLHIATKAVVVDELGIDPDIPLLISEQMARQPFVQKAIELGIFANRQIIVQKKGQPILANRVYVIEPPVNDGFYRNKLLDRLRIEGDPDFNDRIYISRGPRSANGRHIRNEKQVLEALAPFGFKGVDPQQYSLDEQMMLFSKAGFIISPHGAGLTNIMFRRGAPLKIIEIFNAHLIVDCYEVIAAEHGFEYKSLMARNATGKSMEGGSSEIDIDQLITTIKSFDRPPPL